MSDQNLLPLYSVCFMCDKITKSRYKSWAKVCIDCGLIDTNRCPLNEGYVDYLFGNGDVEG